MAADATLLALIFTRGVSPAETRMPAAGDCVTTTPAGAIAAGAGAGDPGAAFGSTGGAAGCGTCATSRISISRIFADAAE